MGCHVSSRSACARRLVGSPFRHDAVLSGLSDSHVCFRLSSGAPAGSAASRSAPLLSPRTPIRGPSMARDAAAADEPPPTRGWAPVGDTSLAGLYSVRLPDLLGGRLPRFVAPAKAGVHPCFPMCPRDPRLGPRLGGRGDRGEHAMRSGQTQMCESGRLGSRGDELEGRGDPAFRGRSGRRTGQFMEDPRHSVMKCHVSHAAAEALRFRSCISLPPSRSVALHSVRVAAGPFLRAYPCVRARARLRASCAGAVRAPDCAREAEGARLLSVPLKFFLRRRRRKLLSDVAFSCRHHSMEFSKSN